MAKELDGYGPTTGDYKGGSGKNLNEKGLNNNWGEHSGNSGKDNNSSNINSLNRDEYITMCVHNLSDNEGYSENMYKDTKGNITIGIGHLLSNPDIAAGLPFFEKNKVSL